MIPYRKSYYLDDLDVKEGDIVVCKCNSGIYPFIPHRNYKVYSGSRLSDDHGNLVVPSARFIKLEKKDDHILSQPAT
jgi:hypothetical protein